MADVNRGSLVVGALAVGFVAMLVLAPGEDLLSVLAYTILAAAMVGPLLYSRMGEDDGGDDRARRGNVRPDRER